MLKKFISLLLVVALTAGIAISGTIAYLTSEDSDVNVMTLGNIKIAQHEYERKVNDDGTYATIDTVRGTSYELVDFTQAKPLLPTTCENPALLNWDETNVYFAQLADGEVKEGDMHYYGSMSVFPAALTNVQDKFVFVENTGTTDAYVRTIIALEAGSCTVAEWDSLIKTSSNGFWTYTFLENTVNIDGNNYVIMVCDYTGSGISGNNGRHPDGIVHPGDYTYNNLAQVYMTSKATNEDVEALDGNNNGTYDILVLSQAVQAEGFNDAAAALTAGFGEVNAANVQTWFGGMKVPTVVSTADELKDALANGGNIMLAEDIVVTEQLYVNSGVAVNLDTNGYSLTREETNGYVIRNNGGTLTVDGDGSIGGDFGAISTFGGTTVINSGNFYANGVQGNTHHVVFANSGAELIINGGTFAHNGGGVSDSGAVVTFMGNSNVTINGGTFTSNAAYITEIANWGGTLTDTR